MNGQSISRDGYRALISALLDRGYQAREFSSVDPSSEHFVLRHDIDMSINSAKKIAEIEQMLNIKSIYFVLLSSPLYNAFSEEGLAGMREILRMGHDIGLHFDASIYENERASLERACAKECEVLEAFLEHPVTVVSFHRPAASLLGLAGKFANRLHTYAPKFFNEMGYCSDSKGAWHYGHPLDHVAITERRALQILTHPIWWDTEVSVDPVTRLNQLVDATRHEYRVALAKNCIPFRQVVDREQDD